MPKSSTSSTAAERAAAASAAPGAIGAACPGCGQVALEPSGFEHVPRAVCAHCGACWEAIDGRHEVDTIACPGCPRRGICESRPTWLADSMTQDHTLADGTRVLIRPLLHGDRFDLAAGFEQLSPDTRRLRFFAPPEHLDEDILEYLTNIDYRDHFAWVAFALDEPGTPGIGVARYIRSPQTPDVAEVAVTVLDAYQRRGLGTLLVRLLADVAARHDIRTFVNYVLWENVDAVAGLAEEGARITPDEPGVARIEIDIPAAATELDTSALHRVLRTFARYLREGWVGSET